MKFELLRRPARRVGLGLVGALVALALGVTGLNTIQPAEAADAAPAPAPSRPIPLLGAVAAQVPAAIEAEIRRNLAARIPNLPAIDEVRSTPMANLYEVRLGEDLVYTDARGDFLIEGTVADTRSRRSLTEARQAEVNRQMEEVYRIDVSKLPLADAITFKQGSGERKLYVFADPECGYCKKFEREIGELKNVTVYTFVLGMLGPRSAERARDIVCSADRTAAWRAWMVSGTAPAKAGGNCDDSALKRNLQLAKHYRIKGTPALVFVDGRRVPGAVPPPEIEKILASLAGKG